MSAFFDLRPGVTREDGRTRFAVEADGDALSLELLSGATLEKHEMKRVSGGFVITADAPFGTRYRFTRGGHKLLDPRARAIDEDANAAIVVDEVFDWGTDRRPATAWTDTVIYEAHLRGMTMTHPDVPASLRGRFGGFASAPIIEHLTNLGVTAVQLMPVAHFLSEPALRERGLTNYWGYNPIAFFAPYAGYATDPRRAVIEFKEMVRALHAAGLEVLLDVVFNHTAEGRDDVRSLRGLVTDAYREPDVTGCGNTLDLDRPQNLRLVMDALRFWADEMHVDGFRFDLATALARKNGTFDRESPFLASISQDPSLSRLKLIAEPWDLGDNGYRLGQFPSGWRELNGKFRDDVRAFVHGGGRIGTLATRIAGSSDLFADRGPTAGVSFITSHDGFTLRDLVSYGCKHNDANGEANRDGDDHNHSDNHGVEGETDDPRVLEERAAATRMLLALLCFSRGVPMLLMGDELGRTQGGNNNAYCQDNTVSWMDWTNIDHALLRDVERLLSARRDARTLRGDAFLRDAEARWCTPLGEPCEWGDERSLGLWIEDAVGVLINGEDDALRFAIPHGFHKRLGAGALGVVPARSLQLVMREVIRSAP